MYVMWVNRLGRDMKTNKVELHPNEPGHEGNVKRIEKIRKTVNLPF